MDMNLRGPGSVPQLFSKHVKKQWYTPVWAHFHAHVLFDTSFLSFLLDFYKTSVLKFAWYGHLISLVHHPFSFVYTNAVQFPYWKTKLWLDMALVQLVIKGQGA